jgi:adenosine kinase
VLIGATDPAAMLRFTAQCRDHQIPFAADMSQQLARMDGPEVRELVAGAAYLFSNEYEAELIEHKSGWTSDEVCDQVGIRITTLGSAGARVDQAGEPPVLVPPIPDVEPQEPTGAGDAFRSGFLAAVTWGLGLERAAQLGNMMAVHALETTGTQEYQLKPGSLADRFASAYGAAAGEDLARHFS